MNQSLINEQKRKDYSITSYFTLLTSFCLILKVDAIFLQITKVIPKQMVQKSVPYFTRRMLKDQSCSAKLNNVPDTFTYLFVKVLNIHFSIHQLKSRKEAIRCKSTFLSFPMVWVMAEQRKEQCWHESLWN